MKTGPVKRVYDNRLRAEQADLTRRRVLLAAREAFLASGYSAVSMNAIARAAGVSREMLYKVFGSKSALAKAVYDATLAGDDETVAMADRAEFRAILAEPDPRRTVAGIAAVSAQLVGRLGPLMGVILAGARAGDPDLVALAATSNAERVTGVTDLVRAIVRVGGLRSDVSEAEAVDVMWMLLSPEVWQLLTEDRGWSLNHYERWLDRALADALLVPTGGSRSASGTGGVVHTARWDPPSVG